MEDWLPGQVCGCADSSEICEFAKRLLDHGDSAWDLIGCCLSGESSASDLPPECASIAICLCDLRRGFQRKIQSKLNKYESVEDVFQGFFAEILIPKKDLIFGPVAKGSRKLAPLLRTCLNNYINSRLRVHLSRGNEVSLDENNTLNLRAKQYSVSTDGFSEHGLTGKVLDLAREATDVIRAWSALEIVRKVSRRAVLLLSERIIFARHLQNNGLSDWDVVEACEKVLAWASAEQEQRVHVDESVLLQEAWLSIRERILREEYAELAMAAEALGVERDNWDAWVSRARANLIKARTADGLVALFPHWFNRK